MLEPSQLDERKQRILKAVVSDYTLTGIPVGSQLLAAKYFLALSSATIRNELADLVGTGYLQQPHTSAGRIPTDRGYRYFVDFLMQPEAAPAAVRRAVKQEFENAPQQLEGILEKAAMVLAQITENVSLLTAPQVSEAKIKHIDLVSLESQSALIILVLEGNLIKQQIVNLDHAISQEEVTGSEHRRALRPDRPAGRRPERAASHPGAPGRLDQEPPGAAADGRASRRGPKPSAPSRVR
jgi:heat-inducible transcriptional repressor